jgi:hypothetical protein
VQIKIECETGHVLPFKEIIEFQGQLKARTHRELGKIARSIVKYGFSFPFFIWQNEGKNWCLDGHGRLEAIKKLIDEGYDIPKLPVAFVEAKDEAEAKNKLLRKNSQYGNMSYESIMQFAGGIELDSSELSLPTGKMVLAETMVAGAEESDLKWDAKFGSAELKIPVDIGDIISIKVGKTDIILSPEESDQLEELIVGYSRENNGPYGFVSYLLEGN